MKLGWIQKIRELSKYRATIRCLSCGLTSVVKVQEGEYISCPFCRSYNVTVLSFSTIFDGENEERVESG